MGQNKEELRQLLAFIETLTKQPGNEEFVAGLRALVSETDGKPGVGFEINQLISDNEKFFYRISELLGSLIH